METTHAQAGSEQAALLEKLLSRLETLLKELELLRKDLKKLCQQTVSVGFWGYEMGHFLGKIRCVSWF